MNQIDKQHASLGSLDYKNRTLLRKVQEFFYKPSPKLIAGQYLLGVDIWEGQGTIDWTALEDGGVSVTFIRLNNMSGGHHKDAMFDTYWNAPATSIIKIPYFVYNPWVDGQANFNWLVANMPVNAKCVMVDVEVIYSGYSKVTYAQQVEKFKNLVKAKYNQAIYTAEWFLPNLSYWVTDVPYWWAQYPSALYTAMTITWNRVRELLLPYTLPANASKCPGSIKFWQCSGDKIVVPGSNRVMDINVIYMTLAELRAFAKLDTTTPPTPTVVFEPFDLYYTENGVQKVQRFIPQ